jgi:hypothetical protein
MPVFAAVRAAPARRGDAADGSADRAVVLDWVMLPPPRFDQSPDGKSTEPLYYKNPARKPETAIQITAPVSRLGDAGIHFLAEILLSSGRKAMTRPVVR